MHLVFLNQYYPPDAAPTGVMLESVVEELAALGHKVTVICAAGGYAETRGDESRRTEEISSEASAIVAGCSSTLQNQKSEIDTDPSTIPSSHSRPSIIRIRATKFGRGTFVGKLLDYGSYYLGVAWRLAVMKPRPERIVALTTPPYLGVLARVFSRLRGADHAHWVMDLYPDVMLAHGMLRKGGWIHRMLAWLARIALGGRRCAAVLTLGPDMAERVEKMMVGRKAQWVPLWSASRMAEDRDGLAVGNRRRSMGWGDDEMVVMYSGNMGLGHRFGEILEVMKESGGMQERSLTEAARFVFFGGGKRRGEIERFVDANPGLPVELHDYAPAEILDVHLRSADVHLVSLDTSWTGTMLPSKLQGIFAAGRPAIFIGDCGSSIASWVRESGGGWVVTAGEANELAAVVTEACDPGVRMQRGKAAHGFAESHFNREANIRKVAEVLTQPRREA